MGVAGASPAAVIGLPALAPRHAGPLVPGLDHEVVGRVAAVPDDDELGDVEPEAWRLRTGLGDLDRAPGDLRVPVPVGRAGRAAVQRAARIAPQVERLDRLPHRA